MKIDAKFRKKNVFGGWTAILLQVDPVALPIKLFIFIFSSTTDESDLLSVTDILKKLNLDNPDFSTEQKLNALCLIFKSTVSENVR